MEQVFCELRFTEARKLQGVAVRYGSVATTPWGTREQFQPGAFGDVSGLDVKMNLMHQRAELIARTGAGGLVLIDSPDALMVEAELPQTRAADDALVMVRNGMLRGLSLGFVAVEERYEMNTRNIIKATLNHIGVVDDPAYPDSYVEARMLQIRENDAERKMIRTIFKPWL